MQAMLARLTRHDHRLLDALSRRSVPGWMDRSFRLLTHAGGATVTVALPLLLMAIPGTRRLGVVAGLANLASHLAVQALKRVVVRPRPSMALPGLTALADNPDHYSFPSGHAAAAMALAMATCLTEPLAGIPALGLALIVGSSRVYLRVHYATDVVVGQLLGAGAALLAHASAP